jgi:hypothetical protein
MTRRAAEAEHAPHRPLAPVQPQQQVLLPNRSSPVTLRIDRVGGKRLVVLSWWSNRAYYSSAQRLICNLPQHIALEHQQLAINTRQELVQAFLLFASGKNNLLTGRLCSRRTLKQALEA